MQEVLTPAKGKQPFNTSLLTDQCASGQYNDEYTEDAHQKMIKNYKKSTSAKWSSTPDIRYLPGSIDDEYYTADVIVTAVDISLTRNACSNSLDALLSTSTTVDQEQEVTEENCVRELNCTAQQYAWGKIGSNALVARFKAAQNPAFQIDENKPYAELWVGTHPNGMSEIILPQTGSRNNSNNNTYSIPLVDYVQTHPQRHLGILGKVMPSKDFDLTFLLKVLSIEKVLSIQAHPDKRLATQLHAARPTVYKDPNHKPEMAIALTDDFEAMCGFRPIVDIARHLSEYPEFYKIIGIEVCNDLINEASLACSRDPKFVLKKLYKSYMETTDAVFDIMIKLLVIRLSAKKSRTDLDDLILKLSDQFPGDSGIFAPLIFNHMKLNIGDAFFIGANEPHAYIQGEILECMACSDNVVRAGLTPKLKDVETLLAMLTYKCTMPEVYRGKQIDTCTVLYSPPVHDFAMEVIEVAAGTDYILKSVKSPSVVLTLMGSGRIQQHEIQTISLSFGKTVFASANTSSVLHADKNGAGLKVVRALSNVHI